MTGSRVEFSWTDEHQAAFENIKEALLSAPCLAFPNADDPFIPDADASKTSIGVELSQVQNGQEIFISYASSFLMCVPPERNCWQW